MSDLSNRTAIVTGATAGIGLAIAQALALRGCRLVINARRADKLNTLADQLNTSPSAGPVPRVAPVAGDAAEQPVIDAMLAAASRLAPSSPAAAPIGVDAVIVNAGRGLAGSVVTSDPGQWEEMIRTNVLAAARLIRSAATRMLESLAATPWRSHPRDIIVIGSIVGKHVSPFSSMYGGTKFAVHGMTEGVRRELAPKGIRVTLIAPGFVVSEFQGVAGYEEQWFKTVVDKIGPVLEPADVARVVPFILTQPPHVHIGDVIIRPTRQDYP
ncbi:MAG: SDR family oxidoreductase [Phycisphaeraceae bacterium]|nr:SDR family oxidoreductase [Phycisphaeraceae bacterium]